MNHEGNEDEVVDGKKKVFAGSWRPEDKAAESAEEEFRRTHRLSNTRESSYQKRSHPLE